MSNILACNNFKSTKKKNDFHCPNKRIYYYFLRLLVGLKQIQLEKQNTQLPHKNFSQKFKTYTLESHKSYIKIFELKINNFIFKF